MTKTLPDHTDIVFLLLAIVLSVLLRYTDSDYPIWYFQTLLKPGIRTLIKVSEASVTNICPSLTSNG